MESKAHARFVRIAPRKVSVVCDLIRNKSVPRCGGDFEIDPQGGVGGS